MRWHGIRWSAVTFTSRDAQLRNYSSPFLLRFRFFYSFINHPAKTAGEKENDGNGAPTVVTTTAEAKKAEDKTADDADEAAAAAQPPAPVVAAGTSSALSANAFASGSNQNSGNVLTGRPTSRVLAPPGGHCSIQLF